MVGQHVAEEVDVLGRPAVKEEGGRGGGGREEASS